MSRSYNYSARYFLIILHETSVDAFQALVGVLSEGFFVYRIYVRASRRPSPFPIYSQLLSQPEEHYYTNCMGKEFARTRNGQFRLTLNVGYPSDPPAQ